MKKITQIAFGLLLLVFPIACASLPFPTNDTLSRVSMDWPGITLADLQTGRQNYVGHCAACHNLYMPSDFSQSEWKEIIVRMQKRAKISDEMTDSIRKYLFSMAP